MVLKWKTGLWASAIGPWLSPFRDIALTVGLDTSVWLVADFWRGFLRVACRVEEDQVRSRRGAATLLLLLPEWVVCTQPPLIIVPPLIVFLNTSWLGRRLATDYHNLGPKHPRKHTAVPSTLLAVPRRFNSLHSSNEYESSASSEDERNPEVAFVI